MILALAARLSDKQVSLSHTINFVLFKNSLRATSSALVCGTATLFDRYRVSEADDAESEEVGPSWDELEKRAYEDDRTAAQKRHQQNDEKDRGRRASRR